MRTVRNIHERTIEAPAEAVGALLDRLSSAHDPIWPSPAWPPMRFDRPLGVGAEGGHGFVHYRVTAYEPGRRVRFVFTPGEHGFHELAVEPLAPGRCRVRHVLEERQRGTQWLVWTLAVRWAHDTVVEELFDNIERVAAGTHRAPLLWSPWVRLLHRVLWDKPVAATVPDAARLARTAFERTDFSDAWRMELHPGMPRDPEAWRDVLRGASFPVRGRADGEVLLGEDAGHLDFRASVLVEPGHITLSTVVRTHNARGRLYFGVVRRFHPVMARLALRRTHRRLALAAPSAGERALRVGQ
ncbi:DUF2867 domain-containing protein [Streptomyces sp. NEAU-Y11]|uniref:DUF2867 domain-containing protein n=1 Tax=Streptomyces cucumeris TaxID=2962890 RepID=UPI0020C8FE61|nr:DUF2867 domain-containing protein [Streptomyces sp. NEAU-Y11]MCP9210942.1 DUF2867 domain-containing protein [Streptomyces sp. NEAU-Y11]